jgi:hypothetical protein
LKQLSSKQQQLAEQQQQKLGGRRSGLKHEVLYLVPKRPLLGVLSAACLQGPCVCTALACLFYFPVGRSQLGRVSETYTHGHDNNLFNTAQNAATAALYLTSVPCPHLLLQEFVSMYRAAEDELQMILQQAAAVAAAQRRFLPVSAGRAVASAKLLDPSSTTKPNDYISAADFLDAEALAYEADNGMQFDEEDAEEECYADDAELNAAVQTLCAKLLSGRPLLCGTASAEQQCRDLEAQIAGLEAEVAGKNSPAAKRAAGKRLAAVPAVRPHLHTAGAARCSGGLDGWRSCYV